MVSVDATQPGPAPLVIPRWLLGSLLHGEAVQWIGRPAAGFVFDGRFLSVLIMSLVVGVGFGSNFTSPLALIAGGVLGVLAGCGIVLIWMQRDVMRRLRTRYVVTRQRLLIFTPGECRALFRAPPPGVQVVEHQDGSVSLFFDPPPQPLAGLGGVLGSVAAGIGISGLLTGIDREMRGGSGFQIEIGTTDTAEDDREPPFVFERLTAPATVFAILRDDPNAPRGVLPGEARWRR